MTAKKITARTNRKIERQRRANRDRWIAIGVVGFFALLFIGALVLSGVGRRSAIGTIIMPEGLVRTEVDGNVVGSTNAPVKVEEFSDFKCTHCRTFWQESEATLLKDYVEKGLVQFTYTPFPLWEGESHTTAEASFCAMEQGKFWEYHDVLFANYDYAHTNERLIAFAEQLDLDLNQFEDCFDAGKYRQQIDDGQQRAIGFGITGTPSFIVNDGAPIDRGQVFQAIEQALAAVD